MKLDRNTPGRPLGKYALIRNRKLAEMLDTPRAGEIAAAIETLKTAGILEECEPRQPGEFFVIRLRDKYAAHALLAYSLAAHRDDPEYANDIADMAERAGSDSAFCKRPD